MPPREGKRNESTAGDFMKFHVCTTGCQHPCRFTGRIVSFIKGAGKFRVDSLLVNTREISVAYLEAKEGK